MEEFNLLISPNELKSEIAVSEEARENVIKTRQAVEDIIDGKDKRRLFILGPCSVHNSEEAVEYAEKLVELSEKVKDKVLILMRVYLEKPRSITGWKGCINDPDLDGSNDIEKGLRISRKLLVKINELGLGVATEFLDVLVYPYIEDLISWSTLGARTTESQTHRQMISGLKMPVGLKNGTSGSIDVAINAMISSKNPHSFIGIDELGKVSKIRTSGNDYCHLILRGGEIGPNYEKEYVDETQDRLKEKDLSDSILIDCNHGNSGKDFRKQEIVFKDVINQMKVNENLIGLMLESNLEEGSQLIGPDLKKGVSITDPCIGWKETEDLVLEGYEKLN